MSRESAVAALHSLTNEEADLLNSSPDLLARFKQKHGLDIPTAPSETPVQQFANDVANSNGFWGTTNTLLKAPEKMSRQGLDMVATQLPEIQNALANKTGLPIGTTPTGNLTADVLRGTPKVLAETAAQVAPGFISKGAILTTGALKAAQTAAPLLKMIGKGAASQLESLSGAKPGMAEAAYKAPLLEPLQLQAGKSAASPMYEASKNELPFIVKKAAGLNPFKGLLGNKEIVMKAQEVLDSGETLLPQEAFQARKAADALKGSKSINQDALIELRNQLDPIAKESENIANADPAFIKGLLADSSRQIIPQNMHGGASAFKMAVGTALNQMGPVGKIAKFALSPAAVGAAATVAGDVAKVASPIVKNASSVGPTIAAVAKTLTRDKAKDFLKKAKGNTEKATQLAIEAGYDPYQ